MARVVRGAKRLSSGEPPQGGLERKPGPAGKGISDRVQKDHEEALEKKDGLWQNR